MAADLALLGIVPRKTHNARFFPGLLEPRNSAVLPHAVRGIFEGDGCLHRSPLGKWSLRFAGTMDVMETVQSVLASQTGGSAKGCLRQQCGTTWALSYQGNRSVPHLCEWLYREAEP
eukprot:CAMPEP_0113823758 /NCGR_PEP_ID=MMETSP0328-20130328/2903_1 /TAXON_ID=39455 /ORGANISM="Alexandrium minutum" /LENGTH=116 /DNA_ID=CAMNT_0000791699 /DNA_START=377 /DNA_END=724 /DNA_ORIENTATION=+ /assembly_acc=CAM_ASM_000350